MKGRPEFYRCGMLNFVIGETGSGKSYAVKEWLKRKNDSRRVVIVEILGEYEEFAWRSDVVSFSHMDPEIEKFLLTSKAVRDADIIIFDAILPFSLKKIILHLLKKAECKTVLVCTERPESLDLPIDLQWTKEKSFNDLI